MKQVNTRKRSRWIIYKDEAGMWRVYERFTSSYTLYRTEREARVAAFRLNHPPRTGE